jgi:hypothetical protein
MPDLEKTHEITVDDIASIEGDHHRNVLMIMNQLIAGMIHINDGLVRIPFIFIRPNQ